MAWSGSRRPGLKGVAASPLPPGPPPGVVSSSCQAGSEAVVVMLTMRDPSTGRETDFLCRAARDRVGTDVLLIADALRDVSQSLCDAPWLAAPVLPNG